LNIGKQMPHETRAPENGERLIRAHALVVDVLDALLVAETDALDAAIEAALAEIGSFAAVDRAYVFVARQDQAAFDNTHEWVADGIAPMIDELQGQPADLFAPLHDAFLRGEEVQIPDVTRLEDDNPLKPEFEMQEIRSVLAVPMLDEGSVFGFVGFDAVRAPRVFLDEEVRLLKSVARLVGVRLKRRRAELSAAQAQMQEREARDRLEATLNVLPGLILELDAAGRYIDVHTNDPGLLVNPVDHFVGRLVEEVDPPDLARQMRECMAEVDATGAAAQRVYPLDVAGGRKWFEATMVRHGAGGAETRAGYVLAVRDITRERERDAQIRLLSYLAQQTTNLVVIADRDRRIDWVNQAFEKRSGYTLGEARGKRICELLHCEETDKSVAVSMRDALERGEPARGELLFAAKNGERFWVELDIQQLFDETGEVVAYYSIQTDVTERKRQEADLEEYARTAEEARERLHAAVDALPDAFAYFDRDDRLVVFNERYRQFYARSAQAIRQGATFEEILRAGLANGEYPDAKGREDDWLAERLEAHRQPSNLRESHLGDGRWLRVIERETPDGGRVGMRVDVTEAKEAQRRLDDIIVAADAGTWEWDVETGLETHSRRWVEMLGYDYEELAETDYDTWAAIVHPDDVARVDAANELAFAREVEQFECEYRLRHKAGHWVWVLSRGRVTRWSEDGRPQMMAGVHLDISRRKEAEERLDAIIDGARVGTWELDFAAGINRINAIWAGMIGYELDELEPMDGAKWQALVHPDDYGDMMAAVEAASKGELDTYEREFRMRHKQGRWVWVLSRGRVVNRTADGRPLVLAGVHLDITQIKQAEERLDAIIDGARAGTWEWHLQSGENHVNERWAEMIGYSKDELDGSRIDGFADFLHPEDRARVEAEHEQLFRGETDEVEREFRMRHKDGHWVWILSRGRVSRRNEDGTPELMVGVHLDIDRLKVAEQRVEEIIEGAQVGTWEVDLRSGRNTINPRWAQMIGYTPEELGEVTLDTFRSLAHPADFRAVQRQHDDRLTAQQIDEFENEIRMRHKNGHWVWLLSRGKVTRRDEAGNPLVTAGVHIDITERKKLESALQAERDYLGQLMETSVSAIIALDDDGRIVFSNSEAEKVLGLKPSEIEGRRFDDPAWRVTAVDGGPFVPEDLPFARVMATGEAVRDVRHAVEWPDGRRQILSINAALIEAPDAVARVVCSVMDITSQIAGEEALRSAAERAQAASEAKSRFLANMSHEIRTPLNGVLGMAEVLDQSLTEPGHKEMIKIIRDSGDLLLTVLNDILDMSKIEAGKLSLVSEPFRPSDLAQRIDSLYAMRARAKGLEFTVLRDCGSDDARLGDENRIQQILHNLIGNALKFTESGEISVSFRCRPTEPLRITVRDEGIGMSDEQAARVFDDFEQADGTVTRRFGGTGLGLSIVRKLAELMGGHIELDSTPGKGTSVDLVLPLPLADPPAAEPAPAATDGAVPDRAPAQAETADLGGLRALVADDNATNRMIMKAMLGGFGVETVVVPDGRDAVETWAPGAFDIILLDISMPGMDGLTALAHLHARMKDEGGFVPILAITANALTHQVEEYLAAGFDGHVGKPIRIDRLAEEIRRVIAQPALG